MSQKCLVTQLNASVDGDFPVFHEVYDYISPGVDFAYLSLDSLLGGVFNRRARFSTKFRLMYINEGQTVHLYAAKGVVCSVKLVAIEGSTTTATLAVSNSSGTFSDITTINVGDEVALDCDFYHGKITVNGVEYSITTTSQYAVISNLAIFASINSYGTVGANVKEGQIRLEEIKFYKNDLVTLIANLVPSIVNKECLVDTISNTAVYEPNNKQMVVGWNE